MSLEQRAKLPALIASVEARMEGPNSEAQATLGATLIEIATRVQPGMEAGAAASWATGLIVSFSKTPVDLLVSAIDAARFTQFQFINEVGPFIGKHFAEPLRSRRTKIERLKLLETAAKSITDKRAEPKAISEAEHAENMRRLNTPNTEAPSRGITEADRRAWRAGEPTPGLAEREERDLRSINMIRAMNGQAPWTRAEWIADSVAQANAWSAQFRASKIDEGQPIAPKRTKARA